MTIHEFYDQIGGDYQEVMSRLMTEARVTKFVLKYLATENCNELTEAMSAKDYQKIFTCTHTMKGVCANLSFANLRAAASNLCEAVRNGPPEVDIEPMYQTILLEYNKVIEAGKGLAQ